MVNTYKLPIRFAPSVEVKNGQAVGYVHAHDANGKVVAFRSGNWFSHRTRDGLAGDVARKVSPVPAAAGEGEKKKDFAKRHKEAEAACKAMANDLGEQLMQAVNQLLARQQEDAELAAAAREAAAAEAGDSPTAYDGRMYAETDMGICRRVVGPEGDVREIPLTNFHSHIVADQTRDDGVEPEHVFLIRSRVCSGRVGEYACSVPAEQFSAMTWVAKSLGAAGIMYAGASTKDHVRAAVQVLSGTVPTTTTYTHLGWRKLAGGWAYLSSGGAIGPHGVIPGVDVELTGKLAPFRLPPPPEGAALRDAVNASLTLLTIAGDKTQIIFPVYAAIWRSILGNGDSSLHLSGASGVFKSELAALAQQHFGPEMDSRHLPANWISTDNSLESLCNSAKDGLLVIDEMTPKGTVVDHVAMGKKVDRVLRGIGNGSTRGRMYADGRLRPDRPPRCMVLSTGEENPTGQSLKARLFIIEMEKGDITSENLSRAQAIAAQGIYASATAGFVSWMASRYDAVAAGLKAELADVRARAVARPTPAPHARTPEVIANLTVGIRYFLRFAADIGAIDGTAYKQLLRDAWVAITAAADAQAAHQTSDEPTARALQLLTAAVASGAAHLAGPDGTPPMNPSAWGWRSRIWSSTLTERADWEPRGERVGWVEDDSVYLEPEAFYNAVQKVGGTGHGLSVSSGVLRKRMAEKALLIVDESRDRLTTRRVLDGVKREVLQLRPGTFGPSGDPLADGDESGTAHAA